MAGSASIRHTGLVVLDLDRSIEFYTTFFSLTVANRMIEKGEYIEKLTGISGAIIEWVKLKDENGCILELLHYHSPDICNEIGLPASNNLGCSHVAFTVDDIDYVFDELKKRGLGYKSEPLISTDGRVRVMYAHDPDGIIIEIVQEIN